MKKPSSLTVIRIITIIGIIASVAFFVFGYMSGIFSSEEAMTEFISQFGIGGPILFIIIQIVQVIIPIIPGGVSCLVGVLLFGSVLGFIYNYVGICIGSMAAFMIARIYGRPILFKLFSAEKIAKYDKLTDRPAFTRLFAFAIAFPFAPDDILCYLVGTTPMKFKTFNLIIWLCKPFAIIMYSLFLSVIWDLILSVLN